MARRIEKQRFVQELEALVAAHVVAARNAGPEGYQKRDQEHVDAMRGALDLRLDEMLPSGSGSEYNVIEAGFPADLRAKLRASATDGWRLHSVVVWPRTYGHSLVAILEK